MIAARNIVADIGEVAASSSGGLLRFAGLNESNAERDAHRCFAQLGLRLPIPLIHINLEKNDSVKGLQLQDWARFLLDRNCWHILSGLMNPNPDREKAIWCSFWARYRETNPNHEVFSLFDRGILKPECTAAMTYHGDEGRGRKKQAFFVTSFKSVLGRGLQPATGAQKRDQLPKQYLKQRCNYVGHVYSTHFLSAVLPKHLYRKNDEAVQDIFEFGAASADYMSKHGVQDTRTGENFWMVLIGVTGDWQFLAKCGLLSRTYYSTEKNLRGRAQADPRGVCHLCLAGKRDFPMEELSSRNPRWLQTCFQESGFKTQPPFSRVLWNPSQAEALYHFDVWHGFHVGVGKTFISSTLALISDLFPGSSIDVRFENLSSDYLAWCKREGQTAFLSYISKDTILWKSRNETPSALWSKGAATTVLMKWLEAWNSTADLSGDVLYEKQAKACHLINSFFSALYEEDVWIAGETAMYLGDAGLQFLRIYDHLAKISYNQGRSLYPFMPKHHLLHHIFLQDLWIAGKSQRWVINPLCWGTQQAEDFIGKASRTSRRVHPSKVCERTILRYLTKAFAEWRKLKYIIS